MMREGNGIKRREESIEANCGPLTAHIINVSIHVLQ